MVIYDTKTKNLDYNRLIIDFVMPIINDDRLLIFSDYPLLVETNKVHTMRNYIENTGKKIINQFNRSKDIKLFLHVYNKHYKTNMIYFQLDNDF
jgi:hypothetical protein